MIIVHESCDTGSLKAHSPKVFTLAAAEHTDYQGDDDDSAEHCQGDYQRLEVHCRQTNEDQVTQEAATGLRSGQL